MTLTASGSALEATGLTKIFGPSATPIRAVDGVDLQINSGEIVALLGPNGAGKTTTLDMVLGLTNPSSGSLTVLGRAPREAILAGRVSAVLQTGGLLADLSVAETVEYVASTFAEPASTAAVLERAGLSALARRRVSKCSGGEQQRLRFALALLSDPDVLILDEPTAGMDVTARREFWTVMHEEASAGRTVIFATHYLEEADNFADRIVVMARGRVIADGPIDEIRAKATGRVVRADVPDVASALDRLQLMGANVEVQAGRLSVRGPDSDALARLLLCELGAHDLEITSGSLDDAFVQLTGSAATEQATATETIHEGETLR